MQCAWLQVNLPAAKEVNYQNFARINSEDCPNLIINLKANSSWEKQLLGFCRYVNLFWIDKMLVEFPDFFPTICRHIQFTVSGLVCGNSILAFFISIQPNMAAKLHRDSWLKYFSLRRDRGISHSQDICTIFLSYPVQCLMNLKVFFRVDLHIKLCGSA